MSIPWFPFYINDYVGKTMALTTVEHGAYLLLILHYYNHGKLPQDDAELASIVKMRRPDWLKIRPRIASFFDAEWRHERVEFEMRRAIEKREARADAGSRGGKAKSLKNNDKPVAIASDLPQQIGAVAVASSSQLQPQPHSSSIEDEATPTTPTKKRLSPNELHRLLVEAADGKIANTPKMEYAKPILDLMARADPMDLFEDILPVIREKVRPLSEPLYNWNAPFLIQAIEQRHRERLAIAGAPAASVDLTKMVQLKNQTWKVRRALENAVAAYFDEGPSSWGQYRATFGPAPGETGCLIPDEFLRKRENAA